MGEEKLYADRDPSKLEPYYSRHVAAMTSEGLHSKSDIAAELAFRDERISLLRIRLGAEEERGDYWKSRTLALETERKARLAECGVDLGQRPKLPEDDS